MVEMKFWRASESQVRAALDRDIAAHDAEDLYALRS
jgi:hypothetical protein